MSSIHINPKNRGKFNALRKRTGKTAEQLSHSKNSLTRKRAQFAINARKWKHELGGYLDYLADGGDLFTNVGNENPYLSPATQTFKTDNFTPEFTTDTTNLASASKMPNVGSVAGAGGIGGTVGKIGNIAGIVGMFQGIGRGASGLINPKDEYGVSKNGVASQIIGGLFDPEAETRSIFSDFKNKEVDWNTFRNILLPGFGGAHVNKEALQDKNELIAKQDKENQFNTAVNDRLGGMPQVPNYTPVMRQGGFLPYKGETHEGGGILVDKLGNPVDVGNGAAVAEVEKNEVAWYNPSDESTYIFSEKDGNAEPMRKLIKQFKINEPLSPYKTDALTQAMVDKKAENIKTTAEFAKETKTPFKDSMPIFASGGTLSIGKAKEMLKNPPHGKALTSKQRKYFQAVAHGMSSKKEDGGDLPILQGGGDPNQLFEEILGNPNYFSKANILQRNRENYLGKINQNVYGLNRSSRLNSWNIPQYTNETVPNNKMGVGNIAPYPGDATYNANNYIADYMSNYKGNQNYSTDNATKPTGVVTSESVKPFTNVGEKEYSPTLSPLGHILSAAGSLADYNALKKAKPSKVSLPRMAAERISLAKQRLANERNASVSRSINIASSKGMGMNAGATFANAAAANTGVNRLLGQENAKLLETEENTNVQLRQQASGINAELAAQEGLFNTQTENAYRMALAQRNPLGNLSRVAASYFADNSAYRRGYDTTRMLNPDAQIYKPEDQNFWDWISGGGAGMRIQSKSLMGK
jgi:hypothetical protein